LGYFRGRIGLDETEDQVLPVTELVLPSPFDFERQTLLYLPRDLPEPASSDFIFRASERMSQLIDITAGRALVLFTSYRNMQSAFELLQRQLSYPILCQGTRPRSVLLERFRRQVSSVLLATASFWEGVDVVGESLSLVCIDKLPFAVPDDPLTAARMELLEQRGQPPFTSYQLPQALLALKQGFGRLVRHRTDQGVVAILDRRILTRSYGRTLLDNLPPSPRTSDLLRVRAFCKERLRRDA
jgi:ATP-dependent DNA helicase DinG